MSCFASHYRYLSSTFWTVGIRSSVHCSSIMFLHMQADIRTIVANECLSTRTSNMHKRTAGAERQSCACTGTRRPLETGNTEQMHDAIKENISEIKHGAKRAAERMSSAPARPDTSSCTSPACGTARDPAVQVCSCRPEPGQSGNHALTRQQPHRVVPEVVVGEDRIATGKKKAQQLESSGNAAADPS